MTISITARKLDGWHTTVELDAEDTMGKLKDQVLAALGSSLRPYQLQLAFEGKVLKTDVQVDAAGLHDGSEMLLVALPAIPRWAEDQGFESSHCEWLREHFYGTVVQEEEGLNSDDHDNNDINNHNNAINNRDNDINNHNNDINNRDIDMNNHKNNNNNRDIDIDNHENDNDNHDNDQRSG